MNKTHYWIDVSNTKTIEKDLHAMDTISLEDGLFYKSTLAIVDANNEPVLFRTGSQNIAETTLAGEGIYARIRINSQPVNPCTITYTPRFLNMGESPEEVVKHFNNSKDIVLADKVPNVDELVTSAPMDAAKLSFGNFSNFNRIADITGVIATTLSQYYYNLEQLPDAIHDTYVRSKTWLVDVGAILKSSSFELADYDTIVSRSLRVLEQPPEGVLYASYIYFAWTSSTFTYDDVTYDVVKGDICIVEKGVLTILYFGTKYATRLVELESMIDTMDNYTTKFFSSLPTESKEVEEAVEEFIAGLYGYFSNSLYFVDGITSADIITNSEGVLVASIGSDFEVDGVSFLVGDMVVIADGEITSLGVSKAEYDELVSKMETLTLRHSVLKNHIVSLTQIADIYTKWDVFNIPSKVDDGDIRIVDNSLFIDGDEIIRGDITEQVTDLLDTIIPGEFCDAETLDGYSKDIVAEKDNLIAINDRISTINNLLTSMDNTIVLSPVGDESSSGLYVDGKPLLITLNRLGVAGVGYVDITYLVINTIRIFNDLVYLVTNDGVYEVDVAVSSITLLSDYSNVGIATDVAMFKDDLYLVNLEDGLSKLVGLDYTYSVRDDFMAVIPNTDGILCLGDSGIVVRNLITNAVMETSIYADEAYTAGDGLLLVTDSKPSGVVRNGIITEIETTSTIWSTATLSPNGEFVILASTSLGTDVRVVVL